MWNLKKIILMNVYSKSEIDSLIQKTNQWSPGGREKRREAVRGMGLRETNYYA